MNRYACTTLFVTCFLAASVPADCQGVKSSSKSDDDDIDFLVVMDMINVGLFIVAGGPEEVLPRIIVLGVVGFVVVAICACLSLCGLEPSPKRHERSGLDYAMSGYNMYTNASEAASNIDKWM